MASSRKPRDDGPPRYASGIVRRPPVALVVDDMVDSRDMYVDVLRKGGYRVLEASDGAEALEIARTHRLDVIVMDLCMPCMDGWEAIGRLKADPRTSAVPVIVLTARGWHFGAAQLECDAFLVKPCLPSDLLGVVDVVAVNARQA